MTTLVLAEHDNRALSQATAKTVTAALQLGSPVHVLVAGRDCAAVVAAAAKLTGVETVIAADDALYEHKLAEPLAGLILSLADRYDAILAPATAACKAVLPRVAAKRDVQQVSEITRILAPDRFEHPIYAGAVIETVEVPPGQKVLTVRPTAFEPAGMSGSALIVEIPAAPDPALTGFVEEAVTAPGQQELTAARVVVAIGRGVQGNENFDLVQKLVDHLGAALGASRAVVDAGLLSNDHQIGQTGKTVAPEFYLALGISGAIQHVAGMKDSKVVAAIDKDPNAPIFRCCDVGLVADLFQALPELEAELARRRQH